MKPSLLQKIPKVQVVLSLFFICCLKIVIASLQLLVLTTVVRFTRPCLRRTPTWTRRTWPPNPGWSSPETTTREGQPSSGWSRGTTIKIRRATKQSTEKQNYRRKWFAMRLSKSFFIPLDGALWFIVF